MDQFDCSYTENDLEDAKKFRADVHKEALGKALLIRPDVTEVIDKNPVESYFQKVREYPGTWYLYVAIPEGYKSRDELVDSIVRDTLEHYRGKKLTRISVLLAKRKRRKRRKTK